MSEPTYPPKRTGSVRIGGAGAFVGDSVLGPRQLAAVEGMQYLVFDYLAEMTLSSFAHARRSDPGAGYASDFVEIALREILPACRRHGIRVIANAGGLDPAGCARAVERLQRELGTSLRVAWIEGDDVMPRIADLRSAGMRDVHSGAPMPERLECANAYLGAFPIARALALGADVVITGRIVDSATTLGALIHELQWKTTDLDALAMGALAGHVLECGTQATGGIHTDWRDVPGWEDIGYPFVDFSGDLSFTVSKPPGTGGRVCPATVSEQILYEVGDPARYVLPDVVCDFTGVTVDAVGADTVRVRGARGRPAPPTYKVSAIWQDGFRCVAQQSIFGIDAIDKARRTAETLLVRTRRLVLEKGWGDFDKVSLSVIGAEDGYGPRARPSAVREAIARIAVTHAERDALELFSRECRVAGVAFAPGTTSGSALTLNGRAPVEPRYRLFSFLVDKAIVAPPVVHLGARAESVELPPPGAACTASSQGREPGHAARPEPVADAPTRTVPLIALAWARSGDKGDSSNVAVIARRPEYLPWIGRALTAEVVKDWFGHLVTGPVVRFDVPGLNAFNFLVEGALDGGGPSSLRTDPMGKGMAQQLLEIGIPVPESLVHEAS